MLLHEMARQPINTLKRDSNDNDNSYLGFVSCLVAGRRVVEWLRAGQPAGQSTMPAHQACGRSPRRHSL
jgi:hypothetical protein